MVNKKVKSVSRSPRENVCFDCDTYIKLQSENIAKRIKKFDKLYLEFGGKLFDDLHAARVLPGFRPDVKTEMLAKLKDVAEVILCINAGDIEKSRMNSALGISYETNILREIDQLHKLGLSVAAVVITLFTGQPAAKKFAKQLNSRGIKTYFHTFTKGYPDNVAKIVSEEGFGQQPFIATTRPLVIVSAPGPNSGKLATCLSQLYHENKRGVRAGYAKYETFPIWNLPLEHPVNVAYEAATTDIGDINEIDNFHLAKYGITSVNYNRDIAIFPVLKDILHKITGENVYFSPTDMGVNTIAKCITDNAGVREAAKREIVRRYLNALCDYKNGLIDFTAVERNKMLMKRVGVGVADRTVVTAALAKKHAAKAEAVAIELSPKKIITGRDTEIMTGSAAAVINAIKFLAGIEDKIHLIAPINLKPMLRMKQEIFRESKLTLPDVLVALASVAATNSAVDLALDQLAKLRGLEAHSTVMLPRAEMDALKKLELNITCTDEFAS